MLDGCILWGSRVVVPEPGRARVLKELHQGHPGMGRLARMFTWWPKMDQEIEELVASCVVCQPEYLYSHGNGQLYCGHEYIDYAGPINNQMLLIVLDAHSKWVEIGLMALATSKVTMEYVRELFARFGLPQTVVTDKWVMFHKYRISGIYEEEWD